MVRECKIPFAQGPLAGTPNSQVTQPCGWGWGTWGAGGTWESRGAGAGIQGRVALPALPRASYSRTCWRGLWPRGHAAPSAAASSVTSQASRASRCVPLPPPCPPAPGCAAGRGTMVSLSSVCTVGHSALLESRAQPLSPGVLETLPGASPSQPPSQSPPPGPPAVGPAAGMSALRGSVPYLQYQDPRAFCSHHQEARPFPGSPRPPAAHLCARVCACACAQEQVCVQVRAPPLAKAPGQREVKLKTAWWGGRVRRTRQKRRGLV